jgi:hypothetical protein
VTIIYAHTPKFRNYSATLLRIKAAAYIHVSGASRRVSQFGNFAGNITTKMFAGWSRALSLRPTCHG